MENQLTLYVSNTKTGKDCFASVTQALKSLVPDGTEPVTIAVAPGIYHERITINRPRVTLTGCGAQPDDTVLSYDDYANRIMEDGSKTGTFRSYSLFVDAPDVTLRNLTIENASGDSPTHGQAIALYADGDRLTVDSCRILGHQDTLFTGPLPEKELVKGGFIGPKQFSPRERTNQYYKNCYICGDVDFIFGGAAACFESCTIESLRRFPASDSEQEHASCGDDAPPVQGYVTAASTPKDQNYGYVFVRCRLISKDCPPSSVYLGRPWRNYAKTVFIDCEFGPHIHPALFHDWNKEEAKKSVLYGIYDEHGKEAFPQHADFVRLLSRKEADALLHLL